MATTANPTGCCTVSTPCCPNPILGSLNAHWSTSGNCPGFNGFSNQLSYNPGTGKWSNGNIAICGGVYSMDFWCDSSLGNHFRLTISTVSGPCSIVAIG